MEPMKPMQPMAPMRPMEPMQPMEKWWPAELGEPSTSGGQNGTDYAFFAEKHRLAIRRDGRTTLYDTGDHRVGGVQQQSGSADPAFSSQHGTVRLEELKQVG